MLPYGLDSNVAKLLANFIPSRLYFIIFHVGGGNNLSFFDILSPICLLLIEFH